MAIAQPLRQYLHSNMHRIQPAYMYASCPRGDEDRHAGAAAPVKNAGTANLTFCAIAGVAPKARAPATTTPRLNDVCCIKFRFMDSSPRNIRLNHAPASNAISFLISLLHVPKPGHTNVPDGDNRSTVLLRSGRCQLAHLGGVWGLLRVFACRRRRFLETP